MSCPAPAPITGGRCARAAYDHAARGDAQRGKSRRFIQSRCTAKHIPLFRIAATNASARWKRPPAYSFSSRSRACGHSPTDEIEAMIAAQAMAAHHASMECSRRAMVPDQPFEAAQGFRKAAANASRTFVELLWHWTASAAQAGNRK